MLNFYIILCQLLSFIIGIHLLSEIKLGKKMFVITLLVTLAVAYPLFSILGIAVVFVTMLTLILCLYIKTKEILVSVTITFISVIAVVLSDHIAQIITEFLLGEQIEVLREGTTFFIMVPSITLFLSSILCLIIRLIFTKAQVYKIFKNRYRGLLVGLVAGVLSIFYGNIFIGQYLGFSSQMIVNMSFLFFLYASLIVVLFYVFNLIAVKETQIEMEKKEIENERIQAKQLREYTANMEKYFEEMRNFRHDYRNMVLGLSEYIRTEDIKGIERYFLEIIEPINQKMDINNSHLGLLKNLHIQEVKGLLASKLIKAQEFEINTIIEVNEPIEKIDMSIVDLCRGLGIILDNAIEETVMSSNPEIRAAFIKKEKSVLIVVTNNCRDHVPPQRQLYKRGFSTKGEGRGLGLNILEEIVEKSSNTHLRTEIKQGVFEQHLEIFNRGD